jgi:hypothetical protein
LIWGGGALLAVLIYALGPGRVFTGLAYAWDSSIWELQNWLQDVSGPVYDLLRASAIAIFVVFWVLGVLAIRRGQRARWALLVISGIFLLLVGLPPHWGYHIAAAHWFAALIAVAAGALIMTKRVAGDR